MWTVFDLHRPTHLKKFESDFTVEVLCHSDTALKNGWNNQCPPALIGNLCRLSQTLGKVSQLFAPHQLTINSGYRSPLLNAQVGGAPNSQHTLGLAADWVCSDGAHPYYWAQRVLDSGIEFDQLILEFNRWVHLSVPAEGQQPRRDVLSIFSGPEGYLDGLVYRNLSWNLNT